MGAILDRIRQWWDTADRTQRMVTVFGGAFLILMLGMTVYFAGKPKLQPVIPGLSDLERGSIYDELTKGGFQVEITPQGEVVVPTKDVPKAKMYLATKNKLPKSGGQSLSMIDSIGIGDSQRKENEKIIAAKEAELAGSIATMNGVAAAQVHLTLGKDSPFGDQTTPPTAAVRVTEAGEGELTTEAGIAMARLVQNSITGMNTKGVTVFTDTGRMIYDGQEADSSSTMASRKMEAEATESKRRATELQRELDQVFGKGNTIVQVDVQLNMDTTSIKKDETIRNGDPVVEETATENMSSNTNEPVQGAGAETNIPGQATTTDKTDKASNYKNEQKTKQYPTSQTQTAIEKAAGEIIGMNVNVMANSTVITDIKPLQSRVASYIAPWKDNEKFTQNVTPVAFSDAAAKAQTEAAKAAAGSAKMQQIISLLPVGALIAVALLLIKSLTSTIKKTQNQTLVLANGDKLTIPVNSDPKLLAMLEEASRPIAMSALPSGEDDYEETIEEVEEVDDNGDTVVTTRKKKKKKKTDMYEDDDEDDMSIDSIKKKVDVPLEQIRKMAKNNPEAVSLLLKSWMMEEAK